MELFKNITDNYLYLKNDFITLTINPHGVLNYLINILITLSLFFVFYNLGKKIKCLFYKNDNYLDFFINIALGYIAIATGIGLLGVSSLLYSIILITYFVTLCIIALYPFSQIRLLDYKFLKEIKPCILKQNKIVLIGVILFVILSFLRLSIPDTTEDGYHTDLPRLYLQTHTTMHQTKDLLHVIPYPQLAEMIYIVPVFFDHKDAVRFIHFGFYIVILLLLFKISNHKDYTFAEYAPIIFASTPLVIRYSASQYTDFFMLLTFLLAVLILQKNANFKQISLAGIFYGAVLSVKMWMLVYLPVFLTYLVFLNLKLERKKLSKLLLTFIIAAFIVPLLWYWRAFIITGDPIYPLFAHLEYVDKFENQTPAGLSAYFGFNQNMFSIPSLIVFSPLFYLSLIFCLLSIKKFSTIVKKMPAFIFVILLFLEQLIVKVYLGRYLLAWNSITLLVASGGASIVLAKNIIAKYGFVLVFSILFVYYFINTLLTLPYGYGWANQNAYLTRVLYRDNASYYDFDKLFNKWIKKDDLVMTHGIVSFYYADFSYIEDGYVFDNTNRSFNVLKKKKITKILIKGGDIKWFCTRLELSDCSQNSVKLLATYNKDEKKYNLYSVEK
jgi:hypothetical protein